MSIFAGEKAEIQYKTRCGALHPTDAARALHPTDAAPLQQLCNNFCL